MIGARVILGKKYEKNCLNIVSLETSFNFRVFYVYAPTTIAKEFEVEWFYEELQDLLELTLQINR